MNPTNHRCMSLSQQTLSFCFSAMLSLLWWPEAGHAQLPSDASTLDLDGLIRWDFSGAWEKDFARSDNWMDELKRVIEQQRAEAERRQRREADIRSRQSSSLTLSGPRRQRTANMVELARLAEYVNRQSTMRIKQSKDSVRIERDGDAPLICGVGVPTMQSFSSPHGQELCGWDRQFLYFRVVLPDELQITFRFNLSPDSQSLRMVTSVSAKGSTPFNLIQTFNRYEAPPDSINCVQTLSRGRVCQHGALEDEL